MFSVLLQLFGIYVIIDLLIKVLAKCTHCTQDELWHNAISYGMNRIFGDRCRYDPCLDASFFEDFWGTFEALYPTEVSKVQQLSLRNYQIQGFTSGHSGLPEIWFIAPLTDPCEREKLGKIGANTLCKHLLVHGISSSILVDWRQDLNGLPTLCLRYAITSEQQEVLTRTQKLACDATIGDLNARPTIEDLL